MFEDIKQTISERDLTDNNIVNESTLDIINKMTTKSDLNIFVVENGLTPDDNFDVDQLRNYIINELNLS